MRRGSGGSAPRKIFKKCGPLDVGTASLINTLCMYFHKIVLLLSK